MLPSRLEKLEIFFALHFTPLFTTLSLVPCSDCKQLDTPDERRFDAITCLVKELLQVRLASSGTVLREDFGRYVVKCVC